MSSTGSKSQRVELLFFGTELLTGKVNAQVGKILSRRKETLAVAESCTGGLIGHRLTNVPGSSRYFLGDVVAYHDRVKRKVLGVKPGTLRRFGAVSGPTAREMAQNVRKKFGATWGLSTTGIAGPGGGSREKPVGLVHIAVAGPTGTEDEKFHFHGGRTEMKEKMALAALDMLRRKLLKR